MPKVPARWCVQAMLQALLCKAPSRMIPYFQQPLLQLEAYFEVTGLTRDQNELLYNVHNAAFTSARGAAEPSGTFN